MTSASNNLHRTSRKPDQSQAAAVHAAERREKGLWTFLTWSFFLSQAIAADQALAASARAAQDGEESSRADHSPSEQFGAAPAVFAPAASADPHEPGTKVPSQALATAPAPTPLHLPEPPAFAGGRDAHHSDGGSASQHASTAFWSPGAGASQVASIKPEMSGPTLGGAQPGGGVQPGGGTQPGGGNTPTVIPEPHGYGGSGGVGPDLPGPIGEILDPILDPIVDIVDGLIPPVLGIVDGLLDPIVDVVDALIPPVLGIVDGLVDPLQGVVEEVLDGVVGPVVGSVGHIVDSVVEPVLGTATEVMDNVVGPVLGVVQDVVDPAIGVVSGVVDHVVHVIEPVVEGLVTPVVDVVGDVVEDVVGIVEPIVDQAVAPVIGTVAAVVGSVTEGTLEPAGCLMAATEGTLSNVLGDLVEGAASVLQEATTPLVGAAEGVVSGTQGTMGESISPDLSPVEDIATETLGTTVGTVTTVAETLGNAVQDAGALTGAAQSIVADPVSELLGLGSDSSTAILVSAGVSSGESLDFGAQAVLADYEIFSSGSYTDYGLTLQAEQAGSTNVIAGASLGTPADLDALTIATGADEPGAPFGTSTLPLLPSTAEETGLRGLFDGLGL
jgi:hypothetical protein